MCWRIPVDEMVMNECSEKTSEGCLITVNCFKLSDSDHSVISETLVLNKCWSK